MIAFTEAYTRPNSEASHQALVKATEAAALQGWRIVSIPFEFDETVSADDSLVHLPMFEKEQVAIWLGYIPSPERYLQLEVVAQAKNIRLLNDLDSHLLAQEFDRYYLLIQDLTPRSVVVHSLEEAVEASQGMAFPIFLRGSVQSMKSKGLKACLAENREEFNRLIPSLFDASQRSRGRVIMRQFIRLKHLQLYQGFPQGREFRVFLLDGEVAEIGYYWDKADAMATLSTNEKREVENLAKQASRNVAAPWITVDIGQDEAGKWWVIEMGDAQFSGLAQIPALKLFATLSRMLAARYYRQSPTSSSG